MILIYDSTFEGLLTCIYEGFYMRNTAITNIYSNTTNFIPSLFDNIVNINTDMLKFKKVKSAIVNKIDSLCLKKIYIVYSSNYENKDYIIYKYLKTAFNIGPDVHLFLNLDEVRIIDVINKRVNLEIHRLRGFIRFNYIDNKFLYSSISPDNDILEFLGDYFKERFTNEYWIINDTSRNKAIIYDKCNYELVEFSSLDSQKLSLYKDNYQNLWKAYFKSTAIEERRNLKLQLRMMPKRYWKNILET
ncbi:MAG: DNA metabolism protein [Clostridium butyricum]|nr:DNA metabolism protein [Clostridium butyricum]